MKILFVTTTPLEYSSSANLRNLALIRGLSDLGHEISTLTASPEENSKYFDETLSSIYIKEKYYIDLGNIYSRFTTKKKSFLLRKKISSLLYNLYTSFSIYDPRKSVAKMATQKKIDGKFDVLISSSDPKSSHLLAENLIISNPEICDRWIQYWGDPFAYDINRKSLIPNKIIKKEEYRLLIKASKIIYVSPLTYELQKKTFREVENKMFFLPIPYLKPVYYSNQNENSYTIGYFGDYYSKDRNLLPFINAIKKTGISTMVFGNSDITIGLMNNLLIKPRQKYSDIKLNEQKSDLLVCVCNKNGTQIPGKIYHYSATNKPILIIVDGDKGEELREYFDSYNRFYLCENNEESIIKIIKKIIKDNKSFTPLTDFSAKNIASSFLK